MPPMLRVALRPRYLGLLALMIAATIVCGLLATWQWDRAHRALTASTQTEAPAVPLSELMTVGDPVTNAAASRPVTVTGAFDPTQQVLVPGRSIEGTDAVIVVTALHVTEPDGSRSLLPVARGWVPADSVPATGTAGVPAPPAGEVTVTGRLEASESATQDVVDGRTQEIATSLLVNEWGGPMYAGYIAETSPMTGLRPMPQAESAFSRGLDWQNLGYALQWVLFGGFFLYLWWRAVRTQQLDEDAARAEAVAARLGGDQEPRDDAGSTQDATHPTPGEPADPVAEEDTGAAGRTGPARGASAEHVAATTTGASSTSVDAPRTSPDEGARTASPDAKEDSHGAHHPTAR